MKNTLAFLAGFTCFMNLCAADFTGPGQWKLVSTNAVERWQADNRKRAGDDFLVLEGVVADRKSGEVRLLAEAVGHGEGITAEFMLVGPASDRAYESVAVTVASPGDIARAVEFTGVKRGFCVDGTRFRFVPRGERFRFAVRRLDGGEDGERPLNDLLEESNPDEPLLSGRGFVFAGGAWKEQDGKSVCATSTTPPCAVVSLYNEFSIFDLPQQAGQSAVYGRLVIKENIPYGTLLEVIVRPVNREARVLPLEILASAGEGGFSVRIESRERGISRSESMKEAVIWLKSQTDAGYDLFVCLDFDESLTVSQARDIAAVFDLLSGAGLNIYGKADKSVYYKAFLPQDSWRKREGRNPQPFELHIAREGENGLSKKFVFIEEDWNVPGLEPKLKPKEYAVGAWDELPALVTATGGERGKVMVLFVFVPGDMRLGEFMPGINLLSGRLPLVHIFAN